MIDTLVIGIGDEEHGDAGAGLEVVRRLRGRQPWDFVARECAGQAACLLESWRGRRRVIVIDAASGSGRPGAVHRFDARRAPLPTGVLRACPQSWGVAEAIEMARELDELPPFAVVYAIEGRSYGPGRYLSAPVARAVARVEERVLREIDRGGEATLRGGGGCAGSWASP